jgi:hypothetical protein
MISPYPTEKVIKRIIRKIQKSQKSKSAHFSYNSLRNQQHTHQMKSELEVCNFNIAVMMKINRVV